MCVYITISFKLRNENVCAAGWKMWKSIITNENSKVCIIFSSLHCIFPAENYSTYTHTCMDRQ